MSNEEIVCLAMENKYYLEQSMIIGEVMFGLLLVLLIEIALMIRHAL